VRDGIIPGTYTYEAGQACCGDHFAWFVNNCVPSEYTKEAEEKGIGIHRLLRQKAQVLHVVVPPFRAKRFFSLYHIRFELSRARRLFHKNVTFPL
jgi:ribulose kinase